MPGRVHATGAGDRPTTESVARAAEIVEAFAVETGLDSGRTPRRYLWTDAYAVCVFLELWRHTGRPRHAERARRLVDQVHAVLGRHRPDSAQRGWLSGLPEEAGRAHPTAGGLRIGKALAERRPDEPFDERLEWERDGQYFHYLTRWMHALMRVSQMTGEVRHLRHALELARAAYRGFVHATRDGARVLVWKMSTDLSRPLVASTGQHDPLDGLVTCAALLDAARAGGEERGDLDRELVDDVRSVAAALSEMCAGGRWETDDPLGTGGLLVDAYRVAQGCTALPGTRVELLGRLLDAARASLEAALARGDWQRPASQRLAFRELGLAIGLRGTAPLRALLGEGDLGALLGARAARLRSCAAELARHAAVAGEITDFWLQAAHQAVPGWSAHLDINRVMLATALLPASAIEIR